jgi:hypothetical protein
MANAEHLEILAKGVEMWNEWRWRNPNASPNLVQAHLANANLAGAQKGRARPLVQRWTSGGYLHLLVFYALLMVNSPAANRSYQTVGGF